jgi:hypothetical protein
MAKTKASLWSCLLKGSITATALCTLHAGTGIAKDLLIPKEQETTEIGTTQSPSFDDQQKGVPQSLFTWIKMAKGYEVEWDTFGRKGWYTQDPRLRPVEPGSTFAPDQPAIYIVFEVAPLEDPAQFGVQWFLEEPGKQRLLRIEKVRREMDVGHVCCQDLYRPFGTTTVSRRQSGRVHEIFDRRRSARPKPPVIVGDQLSASGEEGRK